MLNHKSFTAGIVRLSNFFKKDDMPSMFLEDYYGAVKHLSDSQFMRAVEFLIRTHQSHFFPVPGQFMKAVEESREIVSVTPETHRIEPNYTNCPPEVKAQMEELMEKMKRRSV